MTDDAISKQEVLQLQYVVELEDGQQFMMIDPEDVENLSPISIQPKTGYWIKTPHGFKCSKCLIVHSHTSIFCPSCGTKMIEKPERSEE